MSIASLVAQMSAALLATTCTPDARVESVAAAWQARQAQIPLAMSAAEGVCFRKDLMKRLGPDLGPVIGYKAGAFALAGRIPYGGQGPAVGELRRGMLRPEGAPVPVSYAFAPVAESDFVLVIGSRRINEAKTREEAYRHIRGYRPFIELADRNYPPGSPANFGQLIALNINARSGIAGKEIRLPKTAAGFAALANLSSESVIESPTGVTRNVSVARETLGDPVEAVLAVRDLLAREGVQLKPGDLISIGSINPQHTPKAGETLTVHYRLGAQSASLSARFAP